MGVGNKIVVSKVELLLEENTVLPIQSGTVPVADFVSAMTMHWTESLNNVVSEPLKRSWEIIANTFNDNIRESVFDPKAEWKVLQPPTGSGKTQGMIVYLSLLSSMTETGALVITRLTSEADDIAKQINRYVGKEVALASHSKNIISTDDIAESQILVVTHQAYLNAMEGISCRGDDSHWKRSMGYQAEDRGLVILDESVEVIRTEEITLDEVRLVDAILSSEAIKGNAPKEKEPTQFILDKCSKLDEGESKENSLSKILWDEKGVSISLETLNIRLARLKNVDQSVIGCRSSDFQDKIKINLLEKLNKIKAIFDGFCWYSKRGKRRVLSTSKLILPRNTHGVILDATGGQNIHWELLGSHCRLIPIPQNIREYSSVRMHVARVKGLGKETMNKHASPVANALMANLLDRVPKERKVLVITHKDLKPQFLQYGHEFKKFDVAHWGAVDGLNHWNDFDTVAIYGLPYRGPAYPRSVFMAYQGVTSSAWLSDKSLRKFKEHEDVVFSIEKSYLTVAVIQAINRIRCRNVIDQRGRSKRCDVFLALPESKLGDEILQGIVSDMPKINVLDWRFFGVSKTPSGRPKKSNMEISFLAWCEMLSSGEYTSKHIMEALNFSRSTWNRIKANLAEDSHELKNKALALGVEYISRGRGKSGLIIKN